MVSGVESHRQRLATPSFIERDVGLTLDALFDIPVGLTMAYETDAGGHDNEREAGGRDAFDYIEMFSTTQPDHMVATACPPLVKHERQNHEAGKCPVNQYRFILGKVRTQALIDSNISIIPNPGKL